MGKLIQIFLDIVGINEILKLDDAMICGREIGKPGSTPSLCIDTDKDCG